MTEQIIFPSKFPVLETERLILREIRLTDREKMFVNFSDPDVAKWFFEKPLDKIEQVDLFLNCFIEQFETGKGLTWAIEWKANGEYIGTCGYESVETYFWGEIGFDLAKAYWRHGIMSEALHAIIRYGFEELGLMYIKAHTVSDNHPARQLLEKLNFEIDRVVDNENEHHYILNK